MSFSDSKSYTNLYSVYLMKTYKVISTENNLEIRMYGAQETRYLIYQNRTMNDYERVIL